MWFCEARQLGSTKSLNSISTSLSFVRLQSFGFFTFLIISRIRLEKATFATWHILTVNYRSHTREHFMGSPKETGNCHCVLSVTRIMDLIDITPIVDITPSGSGFPIQQRADSPLTPLAAVN